MSSEKWISVVCLMGFVGAGVAAYNSGQQQASYLFFVLVGVFTTLLLYQEYRQRTAPVKGPQDPSVQWVARVNRKGGEPEATFKYPKNALVILRYCVALSTLFGPALYFAPSSGPADIDLIGLAIFELVMVGGFYMAYRACVAYAVDVQANSVTVRGLFRNRQFRFSALGKIALLESGGRGAKYILALYDKKGWRLCSFGDGLERFEELVALVKERAFTNGTPYRYRDKWGCWTN